MPRIPFRYFGVLVALCATVNSTNLFAKCEEIHASSSRNGCFDGCIDQRAIAQFIELTTHDGGLLSQLPIEIRLQRTGKIQQATEISSNGVLTVVTTFSVKNSKDQTSIPCTIRRVFHLKNFGKNGSCQYEIHKKMRALVLRGSGMEPQYLVFPSEELLKDGSALFQRLVERASTALQDPESAPKLSSLLRSKGFCSVAIIPRDKKAAERISASELFRDDTQANGMLVAWLTKWNIDKNSPKELLSESWNLSPICLYPVEALDEMMWTTLSFVGAEHEQIIGSPKEMQSIRSDDILGISPLLEKREVIPIRIDGSSSIDQRPYGVVCSDEELYRIQKHEQRSQVSRKGVCHTFKILPVSPEFSCDESPIGGTSLWLTGLSQRSDDLLRLFVFDASVDRSKMRENLFREYPLLRRIIDARSCVRKEMTVGESLELSLKELEPIVSKLQMTDRRKVCRISMAVLLGVEAGALFGDVRAFEKDGLQFAFAVNEKLGALCAERGCLQALLLSQEDAFLTNLKKETPELSSLDLYLRESERARSALLPVREWLEVRSIVTATLSSIPQLSERATLEYELLHQIFAHVPAAAMDEEVQAPFGLSLAKRAPRMRPLFSTYVWERLDPIHRDGIFLSKVRYTYEAEILKNPKSPWRGRFWEWLSQKQEKEKISRRPGSKYLREDERLAYIARFENGRLIRPQEFVSSQPKDAIFVVGADGMIYFGRKSDNSGEDGLAFNHASFTAGGPVVACGKVTLLDGKIIAMTDSSGHYRPRRAEILTAIKSLQESGAEMDDAQIEMLGEPRQTIAELLKKTSAE